jgi:iron complex transport system permease protein
MGLLPEVEVNPEPTLLNPLERKGFAHLPVWVWLLLLAALLGMVFFASLSLGSVAVPLKDVWASLSGGVPEKAVFGKIVLGIRLPKAITAVLAGMALSVAGLQMQTLFRNPLADPFVLGVNSGASLGVALVVLAVGPGSAAMLSSLGLLGNYGMVIAASMGSAAVLFLVMFMASRVDLMTLLILGLMMGYAASAIVNILLFFSMPERLQAFFSWTFGSFGTVTWRQLGAFAPAVALGVGLALFSCKTLNAMLLGEAYTTSLGVNLRFWRIWILLSASLLTGAVTGFCGPIGFIGVAVPHLCRSLLQRSDHRMLMPVVLLMGAVIALIADLVAQVPGSSMVLPLNAITALMGAPVIMAILLQKRNLRQAFGPSA